MTSFNQQQQQEQQHQPQEISPALHVQQKQHQQLQQYHGIPCVPFAKRSTSEELYRPVVFVDCEMDPLELPFGAGSGYQVIQQRRRNKTKTATRTWRYVGLWIMLVLALATAVWYFASITTLKHATNTVFAVEADLPENGLDDTFLFPGNLVTRP